MKNATGAEKKAAKAFYPELVDEGGFRAVDPLQEAQIDEDAEEQQGKTESWHIFKTP